MNNADYYLSNGSQVQEHQYIRPIYIVRGEKMLLKPSYYISNRLKYRKENLLDWHIP